MADQVPVPAAPAPAPAAAPAAPAAQTFAELVTNSQVPAAAPAAPAAAPAVVPAGDATPASVPPGDSTLKDKLADAEKRLQDTQRWGHKNAQEAAQLKQALTQIQSHPVVGKLLEAMAQGQPQPAGSPQAEADQKEMAAAWADYQTSKTEEEAFSKLLKFAETRAARKATTETQKVMTDRENAARMAQRNQLTVQAINKSVTDSAPDVPLELFWAMSGRAEAECPVEIADYTERLQWQVGRAVDLSRGVMRPRVAAAASAATTQAQVQQQAGAIMSGGGSAPAAVPAAAPDKIRTMADYIKDMQRGQMGQKA